LHDVVIVGGGPGGYAAALYAHNFGLSVALVERDRPGGTCLIRGCIPAKQWLHIAEVYTTVSHAADYGVVTSGPQLDWPAALAKKNQTVDAVVRGLAGLLKQRGVEVVEGVGKLGSPKTVEVTTGTGVTTLEGRSVILATGSHARTIPGYEIDGKRIVTSDHALDWESQPGRVGVIGGGVIGCEFASFLIDVGTEVWVFEMMDQIIPGSDPETARMLQRLLQKRGVKFHVGAGVGPAEVGPSGVVIPTGEERVEVDIALVAVGRGPNTENIGLEDTAVEVDRGFVIVDPASMMTAEPGVYAVGDIVAGTPQLAHVGFAEGIAAIHHIATGESRPVNYDAVPRVTYTHPEVAEVGITEAEAVRRGIEVEAEKHFFNGVGRAMIIGENQGHVKVLSQKGGPIVGASIVGPQAGEMIHELMYAVGWEAIPEEAAGLIHAHPTLSETIGETLMSAAGKSLH
jgi:dihydrolipoamide dehydrogenase